MIDNETLEKYGIKVVAAAKITDEFYQITQYGELKNNYLYDLYVHNMTINDMLDYLSGNTMPRLLSQGDNHAVVCKHNEDLRIFFWDKECNGIELYYISLELDKLF